jgi:hypothetical protein
LPAEVLILDLSVEHGHCAANELVRVAAYMCHMSLDGNMWS